MYLVMVDDESKVIHMVTTTSLATIDELYKLLSSYGIVMQTVSDNGPQFSSRSLTYFVRRLELNI